MALGNNLKRIKKDTLIPSKKGTKDIGNPKPTKKALPTVAKTKVKPKATKVKVQKTIKKHLTPIEPKKESKTNPILSKPKELANLEEKILVGGTENASFTAKLIPSRRKTVRKTKLVLEGSVSLLEAESIKNCLATTFSEYDLIDIQFVNITQLDIIPIQLISLFIGFYKDKKVKVDSDLPFDMKIIIERAGFGPLMFKEEAA